MHVGFKGNFPYNIGDEVLVKINGNIFGKSKVTEKPEGNNLLGVRLDEESVKYIEVKNQERHKCICELVSQ